MDQVVDNKPLQEWEIKLGEVVFNRSNLELEIRYDSRSPGFRGQIRIQKVPEALARDLVKNRGTITVGSDQFVATHCEIRSCMVNTYVTLHGKLPLNLQAALAAAAKHRKPATDTGGTE